MQVVLVAGAAVEEDQPEAPQVVRRLLDEVDGIFFSGDAIYDEMLIDDLPDSDRNAYRRTMARILDLPVSMAHGGHGESFSADRMRAIAQAYLDGRRA